MNVRYYVLFIIMSNMLNASMVEIDLDTFDAYIGQCIKKANKSGTYATLGIENDQYNTICKALYGSVQNITIFYKKQYHENVPSQMLRRYVRTILNNHCRVEWAPEDFIELKYHLKVALN